MKLLLISSTNNVRNGYGNFTHEYCRALKAKGIAFKLLLPADEQRYDYTDYDVEYVLPPYIFTIKSKVFLKYLTFSYKTSADLIHSFNEFPYSIIAQKIASQNKIPYIITAHGTYAVKPLQNALDKFFLKRAYKGASYITAVSNFTKNSILKYVDLTTKIKVIHNGVNFKRFDRTIDSSSLKRKFPGKEIILTTGAIKPRKGHDTTIKALGILRKKRDDFQYVVVGTAGEAHGDTYKENLRKSIQELGLEKNVTFTGSISDRELENYFHACTIFIHTPRMVNWNFEGFGIVYLEASACKKPIVAADSGGIRDAVVDGKTGIVVPENDPERTALALNTLLDMPDLAKQMGEAGYQYAKEHDWSRIADQFLALYNELT